MAESTVLAASPGEARTTPPSEVAGAISTAKMGSLGVAVASRAARRAVPLYYTVPPAASKSESSNPAAAGSCGMLSSPVYAPTPTATSKRPRS